jgi:hypothetical protein
LADDTSAHQSVVGFCHSLVIAQAMLSLGMLVCEEPQHPRLCIFKRGSTQRVKEGWWERGRTTVSTPVSSSTRRRCTQPTPPVCVGVTVITKSSPSHVALAFVINPL